MKPILGFVVLAVASSSWAQCFVNGVDLGCLPYTQGGGTVTYSTFFPPIGTAYQLKLTDVGTDSAVIYNHPDQGTLGYTTGTFQAYVPGAGANGGFDTLAPYMYFEVEAIGGPTGTYALVIVANSGFNNFTNDAWYTDGVGPNSTVHISLQGVWTPGDAALLGITNPDWLSC